jgi:erythromycin esterase
LNLIVSDRLLFWLIELVNLKMVWASWFTVIEIIIRKIPTSIMSRWIKAMSITLGMLLCSQVYCQLLSREQIRKIRETSKIIYSDANSTQPNWQPLSPHLKNKRLILLGEFNHGSKEVFELHNSLIKYLHESKGIDVILFESGIGELITPDLDRDQMTASQMTNGFFGNWRTQEFIELMSYVKSQNISIAGFDVQRTGGSFSSLLESILKKHNIDSVQYSKLESRYGSCASELSQKNAVYESLKGKVTYLIADYQKLFKQLELKDSANPSRELKLTCVTIQNRICYLTYMLQFLNDQDWSKRWAARDSAMASNVQWLIDSVYKDQSVIIIGHNYHIGRYNRNEVVMGEILKDKFKDEMYSIGFFAGSGTYLNNSGHEVKMLPPDSTALDIKHIVATLTGTVNFINVSNQPVKGLEWMNQEITVNDTFVDLRNSNKMNLSKTFDGLILLDQVSPAKKN